jgi:mlo protein
MSMGQELIRKLVRPRDDLFWFNRPQLLLYLIHFILFQNAFELAYFFWLLKTFGFTSCIMGKAWVVISRLVIGVFVQILCSYSTLPLYALVTQMGSQIKHSIFQESTELAIHGWHEKVKEKRKKRKLNHRLVSSSIHKTFGLSSKLKHHNSTPRSVRLSKGHATKSTPMDQVNTGLHHTQDIVQSDNSKLSDGTHVVEIAEH